MNKRCARLLAGVLAALIAFPSVGQAARAGSIDDAVRWSVMEPEIGDLDLEDEDTKPENPDSEEEIPEEEPEDTEDLEDPKPEGQEGPEADPLAEPEEEPEGQTPLSEEEVYIKGSVEVMITAGVPVQTDQEFEIRLEGAGTKTAVLAASKEDELVPSRTSVLFFDLEAGSYDLTVSAKGYGTYTQTIQADGRLSRIQLYTGQARVGTDQAHPGLLAKGDVNGDGKVDEKDVDGLVDAMESGQYADHLDLYGDGAVDLLDLNYLSGILKQQTKAAPEYLIPLSAAELTVTKGNIQSGSAELLSEGREGLLLASAGGVISENNPAELAFDFSKYTEAPKMEQIVIGAPTEKAHSVIGGSVVVVTEEDQPLTGEFLFEPLMTPVAARQGGQLSVTQKEDGTIYIDLGGQIAVKKIILTIKKTSDAKNLAEISKVEFVNDMASRIPEPDLNIPANLAAEPGNKSFTVSWKKQNNVTAYEVFVSSEGKTESRRTTQTSLTVQQFQGREMVNHTPYEVKVRSLNGEWKSGDSETVTVIPKPDGKPPAPDRVKVTGGYRCLDVRWSRMKDTDSFNLFYKEAGASKYEKIAGIEGNFYQIDGLKDDTEYEVYLTGVNELGEGPASLKASDRTISGLVAAKLPAYGLINTSEGVGKLSAHIVSATYGGGNANMVDSPLDTKDGSALGVFDNSYTSYVNRNDWDFGGAYPDGNKGVTAQLDKAYEIGMITLAQPMDAGNFTYVNVQYWDESGQRKTVEGASISQRISENRKYYLIKWKEPIKTSRIKVAVGQSSGKQKVAIAEIRFHQYDSLEQEILGLYADDLFITLKEDVTADTIQQLEKRLETPDPVCGELHPDYVALKKELETAKQLLETEGLGGVIPVNPMIAAGKNSGISVGGVTTIQPLGVTAAAGEKIVVYVGNPGMKTGSGTKLSLVYTQQHAESDGLSQSVNLKIGRNELTVPSLLSTKVEKGGALYVQYNGDDPEDQYAVRVSGGSTFPVLNVYRVPEAERAERIREYIKELKTYVGDLASAHGELHTGSGNASVQYDYQQTTCILNMTDIVTDYMMFSVPASQVLAGLGSSGQEKTLENSLDAMDRMMLLFYQHKGLTDSFAEGTASAVIEENHLPYGYLNIRYMKMFAGAFMYAAGNHIGIEWGSVPGLMNSVPVVSDESGRYQSGRYFGWGIAHEIGHQINQSAYAHAEVTNNYFSVLAQAKDRNDSVRFQYEKVFDKVTSGAVGYADNVFTQLGMYWQLHLAYDRDYNYKMYDNYQEIKEHLFFARVDGYARNPGSAPGNLKIPGNRDQAFMRLASAAAERNLTDFFVRWGMRPDSETKAYIEQFPEEERAIYYVDDDARAYEMEYGSKGGFAGKDVVTSAKVTSGANGDVSLQIGSSAPEGQLQGYEITRVFREWGEERREVAGFTRTGTFTDQVSFAANHVVTYEVTAIDRWLNRSNVYSAKSEKIDGSGRLGKSGWMVETNLTSAADQEQSANDDGPCEPAKTPAIQMVIDGKADQVYTGSAKEDAYVILKLNRMEEVAAFGYQCPDSAGAIKQYRIEVSADGENYRTVQEGTFELTDGSAKVYFMKDGKNAACDAAWVKFTAVGQKEIKAAEFDLYGPSGDNVEILEEGIGVLTEAYAYDKNDPKNVIPEGSIVFYGTYEGNPAYNVVVLYDENGKIVGGTDEEGTLRAHQIILAKPLTEADAMLGKVSDGKWLYWFEPADGIKKSDLPRQVRAELYRVDDAGTNEGQRLVSDTLFVTVPETLPGLTLGNGG